MAKLGIAAAQGAYSALSPLARTGMQKLGALAGTGERLALATATDASTMSKGIVASATSSAENAVMSVAEQEVAVMGRGTAKEVAGTSERALASVPTTENAHIARKIAEGHAFEKHILRGGEFPGWIRTRRQFAEHIENVLQNPTRKKNLQEGRRIFWHEESSSVVVPTLKQETVARRFSQERGKVILTRQKGDIYDFSKKKRKDYDCQVYVR